MGEKAFFQSILALKCIVGQADVNYNLIIKNTEGNK